MYPRIRDLREDRDLKQREVAEYLNCSQQVYSNYELGQRDVPSETLIRLSRFYNVSVDYILVAARARWQTARVPCQI